MVIQEVKPRRKFEDVRAMDGLSSCSSVKETCGICSGRSWGCVPEVWDRIRWKIKGEEMA